jgi:hypothetical protein
MQRLGRLLALFLLAGLVVALLPQTLTPQAAPALPPGSAGRQAATTATPTQPQSPLPTPTPTFTPTPTNTPTPTPTFTPTPTPHRWYLPLIFKRGK